MFQKLGQVMVYVEDQDRAVDFWKEKLGFHVRSEEKESGMRWIELVPEETSETSIVLHDKAFVQKMDPEMNLGTPSLMFFTDDLDHLYGTMQKRGVTVGDVVDMPGGRVFNFADDEGQYFAVMEQKK
ncbi:VOC family protein [Halobacillus sp. BAB-2008]|uniref:VOC family protein n=1 Tax=Halobacillus sp. BAB-2008 TaxID=1246484 RepID=UPI0002A5186C|nr:VOC family protein [Halobacillus sp. BAB-2008]ELK44863.1 glyoxalase [Halobacillus sp. BAB-2008]